MSLTTECMTPADLAAVCGNNNNDDGMFGGNSAWWIIILLLFGWGRNGYGGFGGNNGGGNGCGCCSPCATQADLAAGFNNSAVLSNLNDIQLGQSAIQQTLCQGFNGVNTAILQSSHATDNAVCNLGYNVQSGFNSLGHQISDCCCTTQRAIDNVRYDMATQACATQNTIQNATRDIIDNANANSRAVLDFLVNDKISTLTAENQSLKFQASQTAQNAFITANQQAQTAELIRRLGAECPQPAYVVQPPQPVTFPTNCCGTVNYANSGGCGCGNF